MCAFACVCVCASTWFASVPHRMQDVAAAGSGGNQWVDRCVVGQGLQSKGSVAFFGVSISGCPLPSRTVDLDARDLQMMFCASALRTVVDMHVHL